ncbi:hypothetical protein ANO14919_068910 [Xylariales sp. No.14919]|nr:hypothetical protein ANO14919_068910 [Xylariales sp. No.14919]
MIDACAEWAAAHPWCEEGSRVCRNFNPLEPRYSKVASDCGKADCVGACPRGEEYVKRSSSQKRRARRGGHR